jgi:hypothetical protein
VFNKLAFSATAGLNVVKHFFISTEAPNQQANVFFLARTFRQVFMDKAGHNLVI